MAGVEVCGIYLGRTWQGGGKRCLAYEGGGWGILHEEGGGAGSQGGERSWQGHLGGGATGEEEEEEGLMCVCGAVLRGSEWIGEDLARVRGSGYCKGRVTVMGCSCCLTSWIREGLGVERRYLVAEEMEVMESVGESMGFDPGVFGCFDLAALVQPHLQFLFVCTILGQVSGDVWPANEIWSGELGKREGEGGGGCGGRGEGMHALAEGGPGGLC